MLLALTGTLLFSAKSIVIKKNNETDHRSYKIELTDLGKIYYKRIKEAYRVTDRICLEKFNTLNRESFIRNLNIIKDTLKYSQRKKMDVPFYPEEQKLVFLERLARSACFSGRNS